MSTVSLILKWCEGLGSGVIDRRLVCINDLMKVYGFPVSNVSLCPVHRD